MSETLLSTVVALLVASHKEVFLQDCVTKVNTLSMLLCLMLAFQL
jgi:hypothetical protein